MRPAGPGHQMVSVENSHELLRDLLSPNVNVASIAGKKLLSVAESTQVPPRKLPALSRDCNRAPAICLDPEVPGRCGLWLCCSVEAHLRHCQLRSLLIPEGVNLP